MSVVQLHKASPCKEVPGALRRIADEIEAGKHGDWPVTTCVVLIGHTDSEMPGPDDSLRQASYWSTYGLGPRTDTFTVRGLLSTVLRKWDSDDD